MKGAIEDIFFRNACIYNYVRCPDATRKTDSRTSDICSGAGTFCFAWWFDKQLPSASPFR